MNRYKPKSFQLPNRRFPRFLFTDIFIVDNNIGVISIVYPDENIEFDKIECFLEIDKLGKIKFTKKIIHRVYESSVYLQTENDILSKFISKHHEIKVTIKYQDITNNFILKNISYNPHNLGMMTLFKDDYYLLKIWLDYNIKLGVSYFILYYNREIDTKVLDLLEEYGEKVMLVEWNYVHKLPKILHKDSSVKILDNKLKVNHHHAQPMAMAHCLNHLGKKCKWLGFFDLDEYLIPKNDTSLLKLLDKYIYNKTSAIKFQCNWAKLDGYDINRINPNDSISIFNTHNTFRKIETEGTFFRTKCIVNPNNVIVAGVHRLKKHTQEEVCLEPSIASFIHYYNFSGGWGGRNKRNPLKDQKLKLETRNVQLLNYFDLG